MLSHDNIFPDLRRLMNTILFGSVTPESYSTNGSPRKFFLRTRGMSFCSEGFTKKFSASDSIDRARNDFSFRICQISSSCSSG